ncbi:hypothetical protein [Agrobacterium vitis]|uniref:hypothetical protein n=1 Tax=Agrobacterium vitis TaxID=373 RepID=UPI001F25BB19|nr:hypothetical protein [Agrobacterium vitis]WEO70544.1 hypothetical protein G6L01_011100 [Agrobacterium vitis]
MKISTKLKITGSILLAVAALYAVDQNQAKEPELSTRLIITVNQPMLETGGAVIVAGRSMPENQWRLLKADADGRTSQEKVFHASISSPGSIIELFYPDTGTYTFKFEADPKHQERSLVTKLLTIGSGQSTDPETKEQISWDSTSDIHVVGDQYDEGWARIFHSSFGIALADGSASDVTVERFSAGRVISLSAHAINKFVRDTN